MSLKRLGCFFLLLISELSSGQTKIATLNDEGQLKIMDAMSTRSVALRDSSSSLFTSMPGFPRPFPADPGFKNFRNITLDDLNQDGFVEVIGATGSTLWVWSHPDTILWQLRLQGTAVYPPSVGDLNHDGRLEIVLNTAGGSPANGKIYLVDHLGKTWPGWPKNYSNNLMLLAPSLAEVNGQGNMEIITIERISGGGSFLHVLDLEGRDLPGWPAFFPNTLAVTSSVADLDGDGSMEVIAATTRELFVLDHTGLVRRGWPFSSPFLRFSYQSPICVDIDQDGDLEIIGATNGDDPEYYILEHTGAYHSGWPFKVPGQHWTYSTPALWRKNFEDLLVFMGRPLYDDKPAPMLFSWNNKGMLNPPFPLVKTGGCEGLITLADLDGDDDPDLIFESNRLEEGQGFIHAFDLNTLEELQGFPLRPKGWTYMNGASVADVNNDGWTELIFLSYTEYPGSTPDTAFLNIFTSRVRFDPEKVYWNTYKGNNLRNGDFGKEGTTSLSEPRNYHLSIQPNPAQNFINWRHQESQPLEVEVYNLMGRLVFRGLLQTPQLSIDHWVPGWYTIKVRAGSTYGISKFIKY